MNSVKTIPSYQEGLNELQENLSQMLPEAALNVFGADASQLQENHDSILKLNVGDTAPDFTLNNATGEKVSLENLLTKGKVVLTFYRGSWCPYCNLQLKQYQDILDEIHELNANLVAISPQNPDESLNIKEKNELAFEVLSDNGNMVAKKFTTVFENAAAPIQAMEELGIDFGSHYSDDSNEIPIPAVFIINPDYSIAFAKSLGGDYRNRVEPIEIINALKLK